MKRIYLAGPEVFLDDPFSIASEKKNICNQYGFIGVFPMDEDLKLKNLPKKVMGMQISLSNENLMRNCDFVIANMTPFRGPSMDVGTAFEMGFMRSLNKPVLGYTNVDSLFLERTVSLCRGEKAETKWIDGSGMSIEEFDMVDNLMIDGSVISSGYSVVVNRVPLSKTFTDLEGFEACVKMAKRLC